MPITYNPKDAQMCWPAADYDATLLKVEDTTSKSSGKDMQVWTFTVYNPDGREQQIKDYVTVPAGTFKIRQLAKALGVEQQFNDGIFQAEDHVGAGVKVSLIVEKQDNYDDQNKIKKYMASQPEPERPSMRQAIQGRKPQTVSPIPANAGFKEDEIPF